MMTSQSKIALFNFLKVQILSENFKSKNYEKIFNVQKFPESSYIGSIDQV